MSSRQSAVRNAMTVDVEDYFHVTAFAGSLDRACWPGLESRVERNTMRLLELFDRQSVQRGMQVPLRDGLRIEADLSTLSMRTEDGREGVAAFLEKRSPRFRDR